jgi:hypothetical protein
MIVQSSKFFLNRDHGTILLHNRCEYFFEAVRRLQLSVLTLSRQEKTRHHIQDSEKSLTP